jgi:hypothetical protein
MTKLLERELMHAIYKEDMNKFNALIKKDINWQFKDSWDENKTFLHRCNHVEMAKILIKKGVNPHALDDYNKNVLYYAQNMELIKYYLSLKVDYQSKEQNSVLFHCTGPQAYEKAKFFIDLGINPLQKNQHNHTVLHFTENIELMKLFIDLGVDVNALDDDNNSALHNTKKYSAMKLLLERGANPNVENHLGLTPLFSHTELTLNSLKLMKKYGANIHFVNHYNQNLLHHYYRDEKMTHYLMDQGLNPDLKNTIGISPRMLAKKGVYDTFDSYFIKKERKELEESLDNKGHSETLNQVKSRIKI